PAFPTRKRSSFRRVSRVDVINLLQLPTLQGRRQFRPKLLQLPQPLLRRRHLLLLPNKYFAFPALQLHTEIPVHHQRGGSRHPAPPPRRPAPHPPAPPPPQLPPAPPPLLRDAPTRRYHQAQANAAAIPPQPSARASPSATVSAQPSPQIIHVTRGPFVISEG